MGMGGPVSRLVVGRPARFFLAASFVFGWRVGEATRGLTGMRGLVTAGRAVRLERDHWSSERA